MAPFQKGKSGNFLLITATAATLISLLLSPALSREWKATPAALVRDYATIVDVRPDGEMIVLLWFVPQLVPSNPGAQAVSSMAQKYVLLEAVHRRLDATGKPSFEELNALNARDQDGVALKLVERDSLPPTYVAMIAAMEATFRQSNGAGAKLFAFDAAGMDACQKGRLSVSLANEIYTWDTPFPGCQPK
jgi:hypothetical protein